MRRTTRVALWTLAVFASLSGGVRVAAHVAPLPPRLFETGSTVVSFRDGSIAHVSLSRDEKWRIGRPLEEIDPDYVRALIRLEDKRFYDHSGVDWLAVVRAAASNVERGRVVSGASTLTMQLVRVRESRPRTLGSKVVEAFRAMQIEASMSKEEILEAYLTYVPYGRNVEGVEAASLSYFGRRANALSGADIATLLAVPQNPTRRHPSEKNHAALFEARNRIAERLAAERLLDRGESREAIASTPVPRAMRPMPRLAPHAARWLAEQGGERIETLLERGAQETAERILASGRAGLDELGIHNGAVVVIDHAKGEVVALVGNVDFFGARAGQIPSFLRPRSPGSALKPFIYAMAIDRGLVLPEHLVLDVPVEFGSYAPRNYDGRFSGLVTLEEALSQSLNVPFVNLLAEVGVDRFIGHLSALGVESLVDRPGYYGLSAAIGGVEVAPIEMAALYAALAEGGRFARPRIRPSDPRVEMRAFSAGATHLVARALARRDRPDFPSRKAFARTPRDIQWKTGTSYGHRDAWAIGSGPRYTAAVWLGNLDNTPSVHLVGGDAAGPILFDLLEAIEDARARPAARVPGELAAVEVCSFSGRVPGPACPHRRRVLAPRDRVPEEMCPYHVKVDVDLDRGLAVNPTCRAARRYETRTFVAFPPALRQHVANRTLPEPPELAPECSAVGAERPRILSPGAGRIVALLPGLSAEEQEVPLAASGGARRVSWFVDGRFLGTVGIEERLWWTPAPGAHRIVVTDDAGASAERIVEVRAL
jgi:penicillin-binding protein 1C